MWQSSFTKINLTSQPWHRYMPILFCQIHRRSRHFPAWAKVLPECFGASGGILVWLHRVLFCSYFPPHPANKACAPNKSKSRAGRWAPQKQSLMRPAKWKHDPWKKTQTRTTVGGQKQLKTKWQNNTHVCFALTVSDWMFTNQFVKSWLTLIFHKNSLFVYDTDSLLECHF